MTNNSLPVLPIIARDASGYAASGSRLRSDIRNGLVVFLMSASEGRCVVCGQAVSLGLSNGASDAFQVGHLVPGGAAKMGWQAGNLATMCRACNAAIDDTDVSGMIDRFAFPQGIPTVWPSNNELIAMGRADKDSSYKNEAADIRKANGLPF